MTIDEMVYNPEGQEGSFAANMVSGVFSFISGEIAKTDPEGMLVKTPEDIKIINAILHYHSSIGYYEGR